MTADMSSDIDKINKRAAYLMSLIHREGKRIEHEDVVDQ